jgi:uracil-DNA glycosylase
VRWTERQRAILREIGVRIWARETAPPVAGVPARGEAAVARAVEIEPASATLAPESRAARPALPPADRVPADWLFVGEPLDVPAAPAPAVVAGEQERLLDNMLHAVRVSRDAPTRGGRACHVTLDANGPASLQHALSGVRPRVVLALGRAAAEALLGTDEPLGRLRGVVHEHDGVKIVVTFALAYLLRHPLEKAKAWADLCLAARALEGEPR